MGETILIMGATGKVGEIVVEELLADHKAGRIKLIAGVRTADDTVTFERKGLDTRVFDLDSPEQEGLVPLTQTLKGIDRLFLVTGYDVRMLPQSKAAIDAASQAGVKHLVHIGAHASPDTTIVHLGWHQLIEAYLLQSGLNFTNLHPTSYMQNLEMLFSIGGTGPEILPHYIGSAKTSWIDADDVARAAAVILRDPIAHSGASYELGTEAATMAEIAELLSEVTGTLWRDEPRDPAMFYRTVTSAGADPVYMACVRTIFDRTGKGDLPDLAETFDTYTQLTGQPPTSLKDFLAKHKAAFTKA